MTKYPALANFLSEAVKALPNNQSQDELAKDLGITPQTFRRWISGQSRPRKKRLAEIAKLLDVEFEKLQEAAGYTIQKANVSFDKLFPLDALSPEEFETFSALMLEMIYPGETIYRAGGQGHKQKGIDITVQFQKGDKHVYQCKRYETFGPQKVYEVVAKQKMDADKKILMLTCVASPQAREALAKHENWELWDRDDISHKVRLLSFDVQKRLVRVYFPGKAFDLLGQSTMSAWETFDEFFCPFLKNEKLFNHTWALIGRDKIVDDIKTVIDIDKTELILVSGLAGAGKTRILKEVLEQVEQEKSGSRLFIASPAAELNKDAFTELENNELILVVDDAHDRNDLSVLFNFAVSSEKKVKLILVSRKYGIDRIKLRAASCSLLEKDCFTQIDIEPLLLDQAENLAQEVFFKNKSKSNSARDIAKLAQGCPLVIVLAAQIVAREGIDPAFVQTEEDFRLIILSRFESVIAGSFDDREVSEHIKAILGFLSLVQPFEIGNEQLLEAFKAIEGVDTPKINRLLKVLLNAGVIFKRGSKYRLSPDILGDYLLESRFEGPNGKSNGLAELYFDRLDETSLQNMITNLGRIDWRRTGKTDEESPLLEGIWSKLAPVHEYSDPHIKAVESVAFYQPRRALEFVEKYIHEDKFKNQLAKIAQYAAYTEKFQRQALECLWELGRKDNRSTNSEPFHPLRILTEMAEPTPGKPFWVLEGVLKFGIELIHGNTSVWDCANTPYDFVGGIFKTDGLITSSTRTKILMQSYPVDPDVMKEYRQQLVDVLIETLKNTNTKAAVGAAICLGKALCYPAGRLGMEIPKELVEKWDADFLFTLEKVERVIQYGTLNPFVQIQLTRDLKRWEIYRKGIVAEKALSICVDVCELVSKDLDVRVLNILVEGWCIGVPYDDYDEGEKHQKELMSDLLAAYPDLEILRKKIQGYLADIAHSGLLADLNEVSNQGLLMKKLIDTVDGFAECVAINALSEPESHTAKFADFAIGRLLADKREIGRDFVNKFLDHGDNNLKACVAMGYSFQDYSGRWLNAFDIESLTSLLSSSEGGLVGRSVNVLRKLADFDPALTKLLITKTNFISEKVADEVTSIFMPKKNLEAADLTEDEVKLLLLKLGELSNLRGHWLEQFLSSLSFLHPRLCFEFLRKRVEAACAGLDVQPVNYFQRSGSRFRFSEVSDVDNLMDEVFKWIRKNMERKDMFNWYAKQLFQGMFGPFNEKVVSYFNKVLSRGDENDIKLIASLLSGANTEFVVGNEKFIGDLLEVAQQYGSDTHRYVTDQLYHAAVASERSGISGQPFPQDIDLRDHAKAMLNKTSRFSPSYKLYDALYKHAKKEISDCTYEDEEVDD